MLSRIHAYQSEPGPQTSQLAGGNSSARAREALPGRRRVRSRSFKARRRRAGLLDGRSSAAVIFLDISWMVGGANDRKPSPRTRHRAPSSRNLKNALHGFASCCVLVCDTPFKSTSGLGYSKGSLTGTPCDKTPQKTRYKNRTREPGASEARCT